MRRVMLLGVLVLAAAPAWAQNGLLQQGRTLLNQGVPAVGGAAPVAGSSALSSQQADSGLREALKVAAQKSIGQVGRPDGFLKDQAVHIPLPGPLGTAKKTLGAVGAGGLFDDLETRMNRAAEAAAPKAGNIFGDAIAKMSVADAKGIVAGPKDAATQYFKRTTSQPLTQAFRPIVEQSMADAGVVKSYNAVTQHMSASPLGAAGGMLGGGNAGGLDLTGYVVGKALDGLFYYIAQQEAAIRTNPAARTTDLLKQVFGH